MDVVEAGPASESDSARRSFAKGEVEKRCRPRKSIADFKRLAAVTHQASSQARGKRARDAEGQKNSWESGRSGASLLKKKSQTAGVKFCSVRAAIYQVFRGTQQLFFKSRRQAVCLENERREFALIRGTVSKILAGRTASRPKQSPPFRREGRLFPLTFKAGASVVTAPVGRRATPSSARTDNEA